MKLIPSNILTAAPAAPTPIVIPGLGGDDIVAASLALTTPTPVTLPGMVRPFLAHQGAAFVAAEASIQRWNACLLGDDMGLGKTAVMIALAVSHAKAGQPALVIAPPVTRYGWITELRAMFPAMTIGFLEGRNRLDRDGNAKPIPETDILFVNDDPMTMKAWLSDVIKIEKGGKLVDVYVASDIAKRASIIVRDEIHRDKGVNGRAGTRGHVMLALGEHARVAHVPVVGATGTLLTNRPVECFIPLQVLGGEDLIVALTPGAQKVSSFLWRYCGPSNNGFGTDFGGVSMETINDLHTYLRRSVYIRREKGDLGDALPHAGWVITPFALQGTEAMRRYERIEKDFLNLMLEEKGPAAMWRASRAEAIVKMQKLWEEAGMAKVPATVEYVADLVLDGDQVVVFYIHQGVHDALRDGFEKLGLTTESINGKAKNRDGVIEDFQAGKTNVVLAQIKAAGMGVTLTAAPHAVFIQVPFSAGDVKQAADRIYRCDDITKARAEAGEGVTWHVLQAAHADGSPSFDMAMWGVLERKARVCDGVNAGQDVTMPEESVMKLAMEAWYDSALQGRTKLGL